MRRHRTTARGVLLLLFSLLGLAGASSAASSGSAVPTLIFPVAAATSYQDDFGQPRAGGAHQGNDIMAARKSPAVAAESGTVEFWTTSATAGCMLYLHGVSGATYLYIHLNNDLTAGNDNRGKCIAGVSYAKGLKNGAHVQAGQLVGYVGDSGDANGIHPHLHFEVHPKGGSAVDPYPYLQAAQHLLFYAKAGTPFALALTGTVVSVTDTTLKLQVSLLQAFPMNVKLKSLAQPLTLTVPASAVVQQKAATPPARLLAAYVGERVVAWTQPAPATLKAELGADNALTAALVQLG